MKYRNGWSSHMAVLVKVLENSNGPVLELGMGLFSTPLMHWLCHDQGRRLVSYENEPKYFDQNLTFRSKNHEVFLVDDWDKADIDRTHWGMVLIDHSPAKRRKVDIKRLKDKADFLVVHDTQPEENRFYKYHWVFPLFKHVFHYTKASPNTSVLSNFKELSYLFDMK